METCHVTSYTVSSGSRMNQTPKTCVGSSRNSTQSLRNGPLILYLVVHHERHPHI